MPVAPKSMQEMDRPASVPDPAAVREQVDRLLTHPLFANSKRYPALLAYVVEQTLLGSAADLKERSIGIEVFGRSPSYDANADPVVRITAGEVRKRLSQYYYDSAHEGELVVELPIGSYVPVFHAPDQPAEVAPSPLVADQVVLPAAPIPSEEPATDHRRFPWVATGVSLSLPVHWASASACATTPRSRFLRLRTLIDSGSPSPPALIPQPSVLESRRRTSTPIPSTTLKRPSASPSRKNCTSVCTTPETSPSPTSLR